MSEKRIIDTYQAILEECTVKDPDGESDPISTDRAILDEWDGTDSDRSQLVWLAEQFSVNWGHRLPRTALYQALIMGVAIGHRLAKEHAPV